LHHRGVVLRDEKAGQEIRTKRQFLARAGQLILSRIDARNGAIGLVPDELDGAIVTNDFWLYKLDRSRIDPPFLDLYCGTPTFVEQCQRASEGTTNRVRLQESGFLSIGIPLPPIDEQRRIVARVEELAALIEEAQGLRASARQEAEALVASYVSDLPFDETSWGTVEDAVLDRKGSVRSGPFGSQLHHDEFVDSGVAAIGTRDVRVNRFILNSGWYVTPEKFEQFTRYKVFPGDILVTIVGASIGRFCVVPEDVPLAFTTKHVMAVTLDRSVVEPRFASYMLNFHLECRESIFSQAEGSAQPSLNSKKVRSIVLPLPSLDEQRRIVAYLDDLQAQADELTALQDAAQAELDALLPSVLDRAFRGEL
jgi:type I restriction enzyme S subunit